MTEKIKNNPAFYLPPMDGWAYEDLPGVIRGKGLELYGEGIASKLVTLPFPPSANRYWRHYRGITVRSNEAESYITKVASYLRFQNVEPLEGDIAAFLYFYRYNAARDLDNCVKVLMDAMQGYSYLNDNQICDSRQIRDYDSHKPRVHVLLWNVTAPDADKIKSRRKRK